MFTTSVGGRVLSRPVTGLELSTLITLDNVIYFLSETAHIAMSVELYVDATVWLRLGLYRKEDDTFVSYLIDEQVHLIPGVNHFNVDLPLTLEGEFYLKGAFFDQQSSPRPTVSTGKTYFRVPPVAPVSLNDSIDVEVYLNQDTVMVPAPIVLKYREGRILSFIIRSKDGTPVDCTGVRFTFGVKEDETLQEYVLRLEDGSFNHADVATGRVYLFLSVAQLSLQPKAYFAELVLDFTGSGIRCKSKDISFQILPAVVTEE